MSKRIQLNTIDFGGGGTTKSCNCDSGLAPIINKDTNTWLVWDNERGVYVDTGVVAGVGTEDFYASTYWVFNEIASGKKVIAKALTDRKYPTSNDESFADMAQKITDMSYGLGVLEKIGYNEENASIYQAIIDYSYELAKGWNDDGSTPQLFRRDANIIFAPIVDVSNVTNASYMFGTTSSLIFCPSYYFPIATNLEGILTQSTVRVVGDIDAPNATILTNAFSQCLKLIEVGHINAPNVTLMSYIFNSSKYIEKIKSIDIGKVTQFNSPFASTAPLYALLINLGKSTLATYDFGGATNWGVGGEENRQSLIDSLITYSYDRASNGMATATIKLSTNTKALLTDEEIAQITAKGFTIS